MSVVGADLRLQEYTFLPVCD